MTGISFSFAGGFTAFLTSSEGYTYGEKQDRRLALRIALHTALVALAVLAVFTIALGFVLAGTIEQ